ncbi:MFS transporter [Lysobacter korlensis]|uniref:MFS transporter n=1 Tax=Lysobacter korlensis TaxID=553636 RepID=A0ABV6RXJ7_9GAMM
MTRGVAANSALIVVAQSTQAIAVGAISLFLPLIREDLGISFAEAGLLAAATTLTYALMQIPAGVLADRVSLKRLFAVGILGTNALSILFALSGAFLPMLAIQAGTGVFRALMFVPGLMLITRHFSEARRATAMGLFVAGGFSSNVVVNLVGPLLVGPLGWDGVIVLSSSLGLVVLVAFWLLADEPPSRHPASADPRSARWVWRTAAWWLLGLVQFARLALVAGFGFWLPSYLIVDRGLSLEAAGLIVALSAAITAPSNILGGIISDRLGRPLGVIGLSLGVMSVLFLLLNAADAVALVIVVVALIGVFIQLYFGPIFAVATRFFGRSVAGLSSGFGNFCANVGGFASALALGVLKDLTGSFSAGFFFLAGVAFVGFLALLVLARMPARGDVGAAQSPAR